MKNELVLQANRFDELKEQVKNSGIHYEGVDWKEVLSLLNFLKCKKVNVNVDEDDITDLRRLLGDIRDGDHWIVTRSRILKCIEAYEEWIKGMISYLGDFNN